jgi:hypothetical protein
MHSIITIILALAGISIVTAAPTSTTRCQDGEYACVNWGTAVGYCENNGWWVREHCVNGFWCNEQPYPLCWNGHVAPKQGADQVGSKEAAVQVGPKEKAEK